jgi:hypothetical protein
LSDSDESDSTKKNSDAPLDDSVYISDEDDTYEQAKKKLIKLKDSAADTASKAGELAVHGAKEVVAGAKTVASRTKVAFDDAREKRKQKKAGPAPEPAPTDSRGELENWTVAELKGSLRELGLTVSGRKDELISRMLGEDVVQQLEPKPEVVPVELEPNEQEVVAEPEPEVEEISADTPLEQEEDEEQSLVFDPPRTKRSSGSWKADRVNSSISMVFGFLMFLFTLSIIDNMLQGTNFTGTMGEYFSNRVTRPYGVMDAGSSIALSGFLTLLFFFSALLYISGRRQITAAVVAMIGLIASFSIRIYAAFFAGAFDNADIILKVVFEVVFDVVMMIPFTLTCWIPALASSVLSSDDVDSTDFVMVQSELSVLGEPESITDAGVNGDTGEGMGEFSVTRPIAPIRRPRLSYSLYEMLFLGISLFIWPFTIGTHIVMALGIYVENFEYTGDLNAHGMTLLVPLYILCSICTIAVIKFDREAREGEVYAKEKLAYHRDMDQYLDLKKAYYEKAAERLGAPPSNDDE